MKNGTPLPAQPFEAMLFQEELEERVEFGSWSVEACLKYKDDPIKGKICVEYSSGG